MHIACFFSSIRHAGMRRSRVHMLKFLASAAAGPLQQLSTVSLANRLEVNDVGIAACINRCPNLTFDLGTTGITNAAITHIITRPIQKLILENTRVTNIHIQIHD